MIDAVPAQEIRPEDEIRELRGQLGSDADKNALILERIATLERVVQARAIAATTSAAQAAQRKAAEQARAERAAKRERLGFAASDDTGVRKRLDELNAEAREIEAARATIEAAMDVLRHQVAQGPQPDLAAALLWATSEGQRITSERRALQHRLLEIFRQHSRLRELLEEEEESNA